MTLSLVNGTQFFKHPNPLISTIPNTFKMFFMYIFIHFTILTWALLFHRFVLFLCHEENDIDYSKRICTFFFLSSLVLFQIQINRNVKMV